MVDSYKKLRFYLKADCIMNGYEEVPMSRRLFHVNYVKKFLRILRITEWLFNQRSKTKNCWMWILYFFYSRRLDLLSYKCGFSIPVNTLGYGVFLPHHGTCVINSAAKVGNYCAIYNNVCLGGSEPKHIGDGVLFATGSVIIKEVTIADGVKISANSLVNKNINLSNSLWGGQPAKLLRTDVLPWYSQWPWYDRYMKIETLKKKMNIE